MVAAVTRDLDPSLACPRPRFLIHVRRSDCIAINLEWCNCEWFNRYKARIIKGRMLFSFLSKRNGIRYGLNLTVYLKAKIIANTQCAAPVTYLELRKRGVRAFDRLWCVF